MTRELEEAVRAACRTVGSDRTRLLDVARQIQRGFGCVSPDAMDLISTELAVPRVDVEGLVSFYAFLSGEPKGKIVIRLCDDVIDKMAGADAVAEALREETGVGFGETTPDGLITLEMTPCIGLSDQAPAALVNDVPITNLSTDSAREMVRALRDHGDPKRLVRKLGGGNNAHVLIRSMVRNNVRREGPVVFERMRDGEALAKAVAMSPVEVIREIKTARLRGRGGAGFPTGMKWEFTRASAGERKFVICNADEGEPGTFKDRVVLTERPDLMFEGMAIAGWAIGAREGLVYLRAEYEFLREYLESVLEARRNAGFLGRDICGIQGFDFDIRIQMGAGAYICGEESALISSCEGKRGDPMTRPPFPAQKGYLGCPTSVNNVETFCKVARIVEKGAGWFLQMGSKGSPGTKLLSISGDCLRPGVYELPFGVTVREVLAEAGAEDAIAVQVGGPSGRMIGPDDYDGQICYDAHATGGAIMVFGPGRDVLQVAREFLRFFVDESCGYCTPCRVGNVLLLNKIEEILDGKGVEADLEYLAELGATVKATSRCGLGQTSPNPVLSTIEGFREAYESRLVEPAGAFLPTFDIHAALADASAQAGRKSVHFPIGGRS